MKQNAECCMTYGSNSACCGFPGTAYNPVTHTCCNAHIQYVGKPGACRGIWAYNPPRDVLIVIR